MVESVKFSGHKVSVRELNEFCSSEGLSLPGSYRDFLLKFNGGQPDKPIFRLNGHEMVIAAFLQLNEPGSNNDIQVTRSLIQDSVPFQEYLPIATGVYGDKLLLNLSDERLFWWNHNQPGDCLQLVANSFELFIDSLETDSNPEVRYELLAEKGGYEELVEYCRLTGSGRTVLEEAARHGNLSVFEQCYNTSDSIGSSLQLAAVNGQFNIIDFLIANGLDIRLPLPNGSHLRDWVSHKPEYLEALEERLGGAE